MAEGDHESKKKLHRYAQEHNDLFKIFTKIKDKDESVLLKTLFQECAKEGIHICSEPKFLKVFDVIKTTRGKCPEEIKLNFQTFEKIVNSHETILRALLKNLVVPNWEEFAKIMELLFQVYYLDGEGTLARHAKERCRNTETPEDVWGVAVWSVDGQRFRMGDAERFFTLQGCSRPFLYALILDQAGFDVVHSFCGMEPVPFNFMESMLNGEKKPYNPMNIGGALVCCALWQNTPSTGSTRAEKFEKFVCLMAAFTGDELLQCDNVAVIDERDKSHVVKGVLHNLVHNKCLPPGTNLEATLEFYFQINCLSVNSDQLALMSCTLSNDGINPRTEKTAVKPETARHTLSLMRTCGVYNTDQDFCFDVGLPAKFSKSGGGMMAAPAFFGLGMYSPFMTAYCKSRRAVKFTNIFSRIYSFNPFDHKVSSGKIHAVNNCSMNCSLFNAAETGEIETLARLVASGSNISARDYMKRTLLHVAAAEGHIHVCRFIMSHCPILLDMKDNMEQTALDDAIFFKRDDVVEFLTHWTSLKRGTRTSSK